MRALYLTNNKGAPQRWVQDAMYCVTWAVMIQFMMCLIVPACTGKVADVDEDGNIKGFEPQSKVGLYCVLAMKWISFIFLYAGIITVIVGVCNMTPENATGRGAIPLVGEAADDVGIPHVPKPVGPNTVADGAEDGANAIKGGVEAVSKLLF